MKIAVTGSSGLIGTALVTRLHSGGHDVVRLVRRPPRRPDEVRWDPETGSIDVERLAGLEAAVNLAGAGVGDHRWTDDYKRTIRDSRVLGTRTLVTALTALDPLPSVLVNASAVGYYGDRGDEELTEESTAGSGFLADVVRAWEAETEPAATAGIRVVKVRSGLVMARRGGAFGRIMPLIKLGLAGPLGGGRQWWSWITLEDEVAAIEFVLNRDLSGPVNLSAPDPARQVEVVRALAHAAHRFAVVPAPEFALRVVLGKFADDILTSQRMLPRRLEAAGYRFRHPQLAVAAEWMLRRD
ncbi:MAG TPA: TIGR01777 family oxidoreductase [Kineosporiaceae bacterium]|nr:TIGR01777 family oxidoreductase [Kineosporiaceae bacterium]